MGIRSAIRTVLGRGPAEERSTFRQPGFLLDAWGGTAAASGEKVTSDKAMGWSAYFACIRNISEDVGKLPRGVFEPTEDGGRIERRDHPYWRLLHLSPNPEMTAMTFFETLTAHALGERGGFAELVRDGQGIVREMWPLDPRDVDVDRDSGGATVYRVCGVRVPSENILHVHGLGYEGVTGYIMATLSRESLGRSLAAQKHNGSMLGNGGMVPGVIEVPKVLSEDAFEHLRKSWQSRRGGAENNGKPAILEQDAKFKPTGLDAEKSQLIESLNAGVVDTARWFRMPPHKIQHLENATFSNIEQQNIQYVVDCLSSWLVRIEQEVARKLFVGQAGNFYLKHNINGLLRGDMAGRSAFYRELFGVGALNVNDILRSEDMPPIGDEGNVRYVPSNLMTLGSEGPTVTASATGDMRAMADAFLPITSKMFGDLHRIERDKATRAERRGELDAWAEGYYADTDNLRATMGRVAESFAGSVAASRGLANETYNIEVVAFVREEAERHAEKGLKTVRERDDWCADADAAHMMMRLCEMLEGSDNDED